MTGPIFKNNAYWFKEDGPFCSACWDMEENKVRLHLFEDGWAQCPAGRSHPNVLVDPSKQNQGPTVVEEFEP